jgi:hypothetical protein
MRFDDAVNLLKGKSNGDVESDVPRFVPLVPADGSILVAMVQIDGRAMRQL